MSEISNQLASEHNRSKAQFAYNLLGIDTVALGFVVVNNSSYSLHLEYLVLALSVLLLSLSFLSGLRTLDFQMRLLGLNKEYIDMLEKIGVENVSTFKDKVDRKFAGAMKKTKFHGQAQGYFLISGVVAYVLFVFWVNYPRAVV